MERIQMDYVDMQGFVRGLTIAYDVLPDKEKEKVSFDQLAAQIDVICNDRMSYPRYLVNISDHTSKLRYCSAVESKRVGTMAWVLLSFVSCFGTPKILHTDNGRGLISLAYDRKYYGVRLVKLPNEEVQQIIKKIQELLPGTKMVHGKAKHSVSQGFIENQNKVALTFLT